MPLSIGPIVNTHSRFIQKQGLDRTFIECDSHMWRVDTRPLPPDITVDGGSDWIAIHRNYSHYLVTDKSTYLIGLKKYYEFSLLPAEVLVCLSVLFCFVVCLFIYFVVSKYLYHILARN